MTDEGSLNDYLVTIFYPKTDGTVELTIPRMIKSVLKIVSLSGRDNHVTIHDTPDTNVLQTTEQDETRNQKCNYRSAVGCLSYIQAMLRPDITMAVQQRSLFNNSPKKFHEEAVERICWYILRTKDRGFILKPISQRA